MKPLLRTRLDAVWMFLLAALPAMKGCAVADEWDVPTTDVQSVDIRDDVLAVPDSEDTFVASDTGEDAPTTHDAAIDVMHDSGVDVPAQHDAACTPSLVVNEIQVGSAASASDEFVEIYNAAACDVSLTSWSIRYESATGTTLLVKWTGTATDHIGPHGYAVIGGAAYTGPSIGSLGTTGAFAGTGGGIGLYDPSNTRVDSVGYGAGTTNALVEGTPAAAPANGQSVQRFPDGADTNDNSADCHVATPTAGAANH